MTLPRHACPCGRALLHGGHDARGDRGCDDARDRDRCVPRVGERTEDESAS